MKNKKKYELIDYFLFDERLSPAALKIHEAWCRDNGYKPQANFKKSHKQALTKSYKLQGTKVPITQPAGLRQNEAASCGKLSHDNLSHEKKQQAAANCRRVNLSC